MTPAERKQRRDAAKMKRWVQKIVDKLTITELGLTAQTMNITMRGDAYERHAPTGFVDVCIRGTYFQKPKRHRRAK